MLQKFPATGLRSAVAGVRVVGRAHSRLRVHIHAHVQGVHIQDIF